MQPWIWASTLPPPAGLIIIRAHTSLLLARCSQTVSLESQSQMPTRDRPCSRQGRPGGRDRAWRRLWRVGTAPGTAAPGAVPMLALPDLLSRRKVGSVCHIVQFFKRNWQFQFLRQITQFLNVSNALKKNNAQYGPDKTSIDPRVNHSGCFVTSVLSQ